MRRHLSIYSDRVKRGLRVGVGLRERGIKGGRVIQT